MRLRGARFVAGADLRNMLRQREAILWVFVMPIVFFYFIGTITGGYGRPRSDRPEPLLLQAPADAGVLADEIARKLEAQNFRVERTSAPPAQGSAPRHLVIPAPASGKPFTEAVLGGERQSLIYRTKTEGSTVELERLRVMRAVYGVLADLAIVKTEQLPVEARTFDGLASAPRDVRLVVETEPPAGRDVRSETVGTEGGRPTSRSQRLAGRFRAVTSRFAGHPGARCAR